MRVIPVIDVRRGEVVAGVGGRRAEYRRIEVSWMAGSLPGQAAEAIRRRYPIDTIYVADLDAIEGDQREGTWLDGVASGGATWLDRGLRDAADLLRRSWPASVRPVVGLETVAGPASLAEIVAMGGAERVVFSLDLKEGRPMAAGEWPGDVVGIAGMATSLGVRQVVLLDVGRVGGGNGLARWAVPMLRSIREAGIVAEWFCGGGLRDAHELEELSVAGFAGVLAGSALLAGRLDGSFQGE